MPDIIGGGSASKIDKAIKQMEAGLDLTEKSRTILEADLPKILASLIESAVGVWVEQTWTEKNGNVRKRVYQRPPEMKAVDIIFRVLGPDVPARVLKQYIDAASKHQEVTAQTAKAKARHYESQAKLNYGNAGVFDKMLIEQGDMVSTVTALCAGFIGFLQAVPMQQMVDEHCKDEDAYQEWITKIGDHLEELVNKLFEDVKASEDTEGAKDARN